MLEIKIHNQCFRNMIFIVSASNFEKSSILEMREMQNKTILCAEEDVTLVLKHIKIEVMFFEHDLHRACE